MNGYCIPSVEMFHNPDKPGPDFLAISRRKSLVRDCLPYPLIPLVTPLLLTRCHTRGCVVTRNLRYGAALLVGLRDISRCRGDGGAQVLPFRRFLGEHRQRRHVPLPMAGDP